MKDTRPDLEPTPRRWAWRIGSLAGVDPAHIDKLLAMRGMRPGGLA